VTYDWLPPLLKRKDFKSEQEYIDHLYNIFSNDFLNQTPRFMGLPIRVKRHPKYDGIFHDKDATFRHLITEGPNETTREIAYYRCETIGWMRPLIDHAANNGSEVLVWENQRTTNGSAFILAPKNFDYKLVLSKRRGFLLLWTQFSILEEHTKRKMIKEFEQYKKLKS
jgi:hypothetical protein